MREDHEGAWQQKGGPVMRRTLVRPVISTILIAMLPAAAMASQTGLSTYRADCPHERTLLSIQSPDAQTTGTDRPSQMNHWGLSRTHRYLGYATALAGLAAGVSSSSESFHKAAGFTTAGLAGLTWGTGVIKYRGYIDLSRGINRYNVHALLTTLATIGFIITVSMGNADKSHGSIGVSSEAAMVIPIVIMRW
jgi:hypothetical protein